MDFLNAYLIPEVTILCLMLGYIVKMWVKDVDNKWIPTIVAVVGIAAAVIMSKEITIAVIVSGALSGLSSTGLHQLFKQWMENGRQ